MPSVPSATRMIRVLALAACVAAAPDPAHAQGSPVIIEGIEDEATRESIHAALPERPKPETFFDAERIAEEAAGRASDWLRSEGYYAGDVTARPTDEQPPVARIQVRPGRRFLFAAPDLRIEGAAPTDQQAARTALAAHVARGRPARAADVLAGEQAILAALRARGYAEAAIAPREAIVDHATGEMRLVLAAKAGSAAPVLLGRIRVEPEGAVGPAFLSRVPTWKVGAAYSPEALTGLRRAFTSTGAFTRVDASLAEAGPDPNAPRDVIVRLERTRPRTLELGASWSSTEGAGLDVRWDYRNALRRAETASLGLRLADREQKLSTGLYLPHAVGLGRAARLTAELVREQARPYDRVGATVSAAVEAQRTLRNALTYGVSLSADSYDAAAGIEDAITVSGFGEWRRDGADDRFDPRRGTILDLRIEPAIAAGSATVAFARTIGDVRHYVTPRRDDGRDGRFTYAARLRAGWVQPLGGDARDLPLDRRFYAGGGGSVRGYAFQSIYPQSDLARAEPPGGQGLLETSLETRARFGGGWGAAAFVDGGAAFDDAAGVGDLRWGAGLGVRYDLGFGPLRLDIAAPLNKRDRDAAFAFYVSFGQAF